MYFQFNRLADHHLISHETCLYDMDDGHKKPYKDKDEGLNDGNEYLLK